MPSKDISIRVKIIGAQILLIAAVSVFIYNYYPRQQNLAALASIESKISSVRNMFSIGVGIGMSQTDFVAVSEALKWAESDSSVVYISVLNMEGQSIALLNKEKINVPKEVLMATDDQRFEADDFIFYKTKIVYQGTEFGKLTIGYSLKRLHLEIAALKKTTLYFSLALVAVGTIVSIILGNMITGNIRKLDNTVNAISKGGEHIRTEVTGNDEISKLARAFNSMLDKQEKSRDALVHYSEQLEKQNEELTRFSYVVSHDLKAPLRAIFKLSEWIEEDMGTAVPPETKKNMQTLRGRVFRMEALINGLLEYSKIGRENIKPEHTDVQVMIKDIIDLLNPPIHFKINIPNRLPVFQTNRILLQQVFSNLISNSIKYNDKAEGTIDITVKDIGSYYRFKVEDNGVGIAPEYHTKVFIIFQTLEARDKVEGTGIGLSIVKKCVEDMGGVIQLKSKEGLGSKFIFTWPKEFNISSKNQKTLPSKVATYEKLD